MIRKIILFFLIFFIISPSAAAAKAVVVLVNQIRGSEVCCEPGSQNLLTSVLENNQLKNLPIGWALRYDAISNFREKIGQSSELGLLLEITPGLTLASGVAYRGSPAGHDWYMAKHSFLVGYTPQERKKLIDTLFSAFKKKFGYYPSFTSGWMVDGWSLSYIRNTYNVIFHELTKEQYETDSYTLYGGIFNFPYFPSKNFPLLPGSQSDKLDIVIARQTVSDLLYNYGSPKTFYTSQPNDYLSDTGEKKDIAYFEQLFNDFLNKKNFPQFALIGFENSFDFQKYGGEYIRQLEYLISLQKQGIVDFSAPGNFAAILRKQIDSNIPFAVSKDFESGKSIGVMWYFGHSYRARLLLKDGKIILDDLRNFSPLPDPYLQNPATADYAYWIIPYLIDGSQQYSITNEQNDLLQKKNLLVNTVSDVYTSPFGIVLGEGEFKTKQLDNSLEIIFSDGKNSVKLFPDEIIFDSSAEVKFAEPINKTLQSLFDGGNTTYDFDRHFKFSIQKENNKLNLGWQRESLFAGLFTLEKQGGGFSLKPNAYKDLSFLSPMFQPDRSDLPIDPKKSVFYWNNITAIAGRNPLRLFILPLNIIGRPSQVKDVKFDSEKGEELNILYPSDYSFRVSPWFVDITSEKPLKTSLNITADGVIIAKNVPIEFITDCRSFMPACIRNPGELLSYISYMVKEQFFMWTENIRKSQ